MFGIDKNNKNVSALLTQNSYLEIMSSNKCVKFTLFSKFDLIYFCLKFIF